MEERLFLAVELDKRFTNWSVRLIPTEALEFCRVAEEYNNLTSEGVCELIAEIDAIIPAMSFEPNNPNTGKPHHCYRIGKEGSRVIYLKIIKSYLPEDFDYAMLIRELIKIGRLARADENYVEKNTDSKFVHRFWWD